MMEKQGASWSVVTKALCGHKDTIRALQLLGTKSFADSRLDNLRAIKEVIPEQETWYLRLPHLSVVEEVVALADISLNTEVEMISAISREAARQDRQHYIVIMIELGDLREGILPGSLVDFYETVFNLPNIKVVGLGAQVGCLSGTLPNIDQISQLLLYRELLELKFNHKLPMISAGSSIGLSLLPTGQMPSGVNHFRIGEALFLGTDLIKGGTLTGLRDDVICLEAEIAEIKEKNLVPLGETVASTFESTHGSEEENSYIPGERGYRALLTVGEIDTDVAGLVPVNPEYEIAGASSDMTVINLGKDPDGLHLGSIIKFRPNYSAFVRLMSDSYICKQVIPTLEEFDQSLKNEWDIEIPPAIDEVESA